MVLDAVPAPEIQLSLRMTLLQQNSSSSAEISIVRKILSTHLMYQTLENSRDIVNLINYILLSDSNVSYFFYSFNNHSEPSPDSS